MRKLHADEGSPTSPRCGTYFSDGRRRVDYVLTYHIQKPNGAGQRSSKVTETNFIRRLRRSLSGRGSKAPLQPKDDPEILAQEQQGSYHEDDKRFRREEFEENLLDMGLEMEKDEQVRLGSLRAQLMCPPVSSRTLLDSPAQFPLQGHFPGVGFLKIHAPWNVLCREAEFMKLKMPTKKVRLGQAVGWLVDWLVGWLVG